MCKITKENDSLQRQTENKDENSQKIQGNKNVPELRFPEFEGEWEDNKIDYFFKISVAGDLKKEELSKFKINEFKYPVYGNALEKKGLLGYYENYKYEENNITVTARGNLGVALLRKKPFNAVGRLIILIPKTELNSYYVTQYINSKFKIYVESTGVPQLTAPSFRLNKIKIPKLNEQNKIANFLSAIDKKIGFMEKKHTLYQSIKKYFLENLFPHDSKIPYLRLPMFSDEFKRFTLNELFISKKGKGLSKDKIQEDGENKCILYGELYTTYSQIISTIKSRTNIFEGVLSNKMDILMPCSTTTTGKDLTIASVLLKENVLLGGDITILRKKKDILDEIYFAYYLSFCLNKTLTSLAQGSTIIHLYWNHIKNIEVLIPSKEEQIQIAKIIKLLDDKIEQSSLQINNLKDYKKGLLQKMFV